MGSDEKIVMQNEWNVREEILRAAHRWHLIILFILGGSIIGFGISRILPHHYRAEVNLHVSYNADSIFRNPDDYKNWNMEQLNVIVLSDNVLQKTLAQLSSEDSYWQSVTQEQLAQQLQVHWRSVGIWRLVAEDNKPERAIALALAWKAAILDEINLALENALQAQQFNDLFIATARARVDASLRASTLSQVALGLSDWTEANAKTDLNQAVDNSSRWRLLSLIAQVASDDEAGEMLLTQMPAEGSPLSEYQAWIEKALAYIEAELPIAQKQLADLSSQADSYYAQWGVKNHYAYGLSMYLTVEETGDPNIIAIAVRLDSTAALVGAALGLIVWCFIWLALPIIKENR